MEIKFEEVSVKFGDENVLQNLSFRIARNEKAVLSGSSGSGKSTVLNLLLGFVKPDSGCIRVDGGEYNAQSISGLRSKIAWVPQFHDIGEGSVEQVIMHPFDFKINRNTKPRKQKVEYVLGRFDLPTTILYKQYRDLSGGQQQRIAIVTAILLEKPLMLLDEPTTALDKESKQVVINVLINENKRTVLSTSHDSLWIEACDKIIPLT